MAGMEEAALTRVYQGTADKRIPMITRNVRPCPCCASPAHLPGPRPRSVLQTLSHLSRAQKQLQSTQELLPPLILLSPRRSSLPALRNATAQTRGLLSLQTLLNPAEPQGSVNRPTTTTPISPLLPLQEKATKFSVPTSETGIL